MSDPYSDQYFTDEITKFNPKAYDNDGVSIIQKPVHTAEGPGDYWLMIKDGKFWGGLTPKRIRVWSLPINLASGAVGMAGLGIGYTAMAIAQKAEVTSVDVWEIDQKLIDCFTTLFNKEAWFSKITFHKSDVRTMTGEIFDLFVMDIYSDWNTQEKVDDYNLLKANNTLHKYWTASFGKCYARLQEKGEVTLPAGDLKDYCDYHDAFWDNYYKDIHDIIKADKPLE